ncbi:G-protein-signaling modulator 1 [Electrophorus electricus]|uniref:G-protein-signaling modulator 1 n=1 Tax=Electrophorus electricus TaxID=8005 RepID=UPI0015D001DC|nr:G-protein-signaling modulator 1 [Electrophorus electricus]
MENRRGPQPPQLNGQPREASSGAHSPERRSPSVADATSLISLTQTDELFDLIASSQGRRLDEQRASIDDQLGIAIAQSNVSQHCATCNPQDLSDEFFNMLIKYQSSRINDQRCSLPPAPDPDEDFFNLIQRVQAKRMDEQRVSLHPDEEDDTDSEPKPEPSEVSS